MECFLCLVCTYYFVKLHNVNNYPFFDRPGKNPRNCIFPSENIKVHDVFTGFIIYYFNLFNVCFINDPQGETGPVFTHPYIGSLTIPDGVNVAITDYNKKVFYIDKHYFHLAHRIQTPIPKLRVRNFTQLTKITTSFTSPVCF